MTTELSRRQRRLYGLPREYGPDDFQRIGRQVAGQPLDGEDGYRGELLEAVLGAIRAHDFDADGWSWPSQKLVAQELSVTQPTVSRVTDILARARLLVKIKPRRYGGWRFCKYLVGKNLAHVHRTRLLVLVARIKNRSPEPMHTEGTAGWCVGVDEVVMGEDSARGRSARAGPTDEATGKRLFFEMLIEGL